MKNENEGTFEVVEIEALSQISGGRIAVVGPDGKEAPLYDSPYTQHQMLGNGSQKKVKWTFPPRSGPNRPSGSGSSNGRPR